MCGIVGYVCGDDATLPTLERRSTAVEALRHRGPDGSGEYQDVGVWFGHLRLSILDLSEAGAQPMATADGRFVITYNGEVYNFRELARELGLRDLRSGSDTEVVLRAFAELGPRSFRRLNGMFAFAIYDRVERTVHVVRDRLGIKPLYVRHDGRSLAFASEIKGILALGAPAACDPAALHEWLFYGNSLGGRTLYDGIEQVRPGEYLAIRLDPFAVRRDAYWTLRQETAGAPSPAAGADPIAETRRLLEEAVRRQLVSDVPVGVFLSGGVDSSAITAFAARHYGGRLATYAAGFDDPHYVDERPKAKRVAAHFGTDHHELYITGTDVPSLIERLVRHHDGPFADAANLPLYLMAAQISGRTKVVLQGDGGDEVFGGYRRYVTLRQHRWLRPAARLAQRLESAPGGARMPSRVRRYLHAYGATTLGGTMAGLLTFEDSHSRPAAVFNPAVRERIERANPFARYLECQPWFAGCDIVNQMLFVDQLVELPDIFLEKVDRATMAASLEVRVPFLDHELVGHAARLPGDLKVRGGRKKWLLKQALAGVVPEEILHGPKTGFNVPFAHWLRTSLKPMFYDELAAFERRYPRVIDRAVIEAAYARTEDGGADRSLLLWKMLNFMVWCNRTGVRLPA